MQLIAMTRQLRVNVQGGATICVPDALTNITTFVLLEQEAWFEDELGFVRTCLSPGQCAVDVGANFGVFTTALAAAVGERGRVLAFEPAASTAAHLGDTLQANKLSQVDLLQAALSDRSGSAVLEIGDSPELNALTEAPAAGRSSERVELLVLDEVLRQRGVDDVALLKVDAEGHEAHVGRGAARMLRASEPLVLFEIKHGQRVEYELLDALQGLGFEPYRLLPGPGVLVPFHRDEPLDDYQLNLFACTPRRARTLSRDGLLAGEGAVPEPPLTLDAAARDYLEALPGADRAAAAGEYTRALEHYALLQTAPLPPAEQAAHLARALELARRACSDGSSTARLLTYARLSADAGRRRLAVDTLAALVDMLAAGGPPQLEEPCLPPHARYAALAPEFDLGEWLQCAVLESFERLCAFSSVFRGPPALRSLEYLRSRPYYCAEMERRRQLVRMRGGVQQGPEPHPLLVGRSPDNLNPRFWTQSR